MSKDIVELIQFRGQLRLQLEAIWLVCISLFCNGIWRLAHCFKLSVLFYPLNSLLSSMLLHVSIGPYMFLTAKSAGTLEFCRDFFPMHVIPMSINWSRTGRLPWYVVGERMTVLCNPQSYDCLLFLTSERGREHGCPFFMIALELRAPSPTSFHCFPDHQWPHDSSWIQYILFTLPCL
jgi:hypothetical protein